MEGAVKAFTPATGEDAGSVVPFRAFLDPPPPPSCSSSFDSGRLVELDRRGGNVDGKEEEREREEWRMPDGEGAVGERSDGAVVFGSLWWWWR